MSQEDQTGNVSGDETEEVEKGGSQPHSAIVRCDGQWQPHSRPIVLYLVDLVLLGLDFFFLFGLLLGQQN